MAEYHGKEKLKENRSEKKHRGPFRCMCVGVVCEELILDYHYVIIIFEVLMYTLLLIL